jgi:hypothetical protein
LEWGDNPEGWEAYSAIISQSEDMVRSCHPLAIRSIRPSVRRRCGVSIAVAAVNVRGPSSFRFALHWPPNQ